MSFHDSFRPACWLNNQHLQTLYPALCRNPPLLVRTRETLDTPDHDFLDLDHFDHDPNRPLAILLHGLSGSSNSGYILGLQQSLSQQGIASVVMNFRGCSGRPNRLARSYHSGETEDIDFVYRTLRKRFPQRRFCAVGFSLGGNVLLKWLGEQGGNISLAAAATVCVPLVLSECASRMDQGFSKIYRDRLLKELKEYIHNKRRHLESIGALKEAKKLHQLGDLALLNSFWQYDEHVIASLHGFTDAYDYYQRSSARQFLIHIRIPTLLIQAADDPFMTPAVLPEAKELAACVTLEVHDSGGHVGFVAAKHGLQPDYWLERRIPAFLASQLVHGTG